jgi:hypothetical protein
LKQNKYRRPGGKGCQWFPKFCYWGYFYVVRQRSERGCKSNERDNEKGNQRRLISQPVLQSSRKNECHKGGVREDPQLSHVYYQGNFS